MNADASCNSMLRDIRAIKMNARDRARAENGVRQSAAIVELLIGAAAFVGLRSSTSKTAS